LQRSVADTVVLGQACRRIEVLLVLRDSNNPTASVDTTSNPFAYFVYANTDTVFYLHQELQRFVPLYVFNVDIGDSIKYYNGFPTQQDSTFTAKVTGITTETISGHSIRTIHTDKLSYRERLGFVDGLNRYLFAQTGDWLETSIRCYSDSVINYVREAGIVCNSIPGNTSIAEQEDYNGLNIYPNPSTDHIVIKALNAQNEIQNVMLYDVTGRKVFEQKGYSVSTVNVNTSGFPSGIYLLHVKMKQGGVVKKISIL
jgi:hypothetical protein